MNKKLIYLASPFSHSDRWVMKLRYCLVTAVATKLISQGYHIFGPITESHMYDEFGLGEHGWDFWQDHDYMMIDRCNELWVAMLKGWDKSVGVQAEIEYAKTHNIPVKYIELTDVLPELAEAI